MFTYRWKKCREGLGGGMAVLIEIEEQRDRIIQELETRNLGFDMYAIQHGSGNNRWTAGWAIDICVDRRGQNRFIRRNGEVLQSLGFVLLDRLYNPVEGNGLDVPRVGETSHCLLDAVLGEMQATKLRA